MLRVVDSGVIGVELEEELVEEAEGIGIRYGIHIVIPIVIEQEF